MTKSKFLIFLLIMFLSILIPTAIFLYVFLTPVYSEQDCKAIRKNYKRIQNGMKKEEVLLLIKKEPDSKIYPYPKVIFPEQETQWEIWLLCKDINNCIINDSGEEKCYNWLMVAFDAETERVIKVFSDDLEKVGFD